MARTRRYMHGKRRRSPLKSHHWDTPHVEDQEGNIVGLGNRQGVRVEGRNVIFDRTAKEQKDIEYSRMSKSEQRKHDKSEKKTQKKEYKKAKKDWKKSGKEGDKPKKTWRNKS